MSPYLHFGQLSPVEIALVVHDSPADASARDAYLEQRAMEAAELRAKIEAEQPPSEVRERLLALRSRAER